MQRVGILECTLRDGSYSIDFQFTPEDTSIIASALEGAGLKMIEIGHGLGLNATSKGKGQAAATDVEYMQAANAALNLAKWGMFFIPGIARREHIDIALEYGIGFLRIGANAPETETSLPFIEYAASKGITTFCNLMKSYALSAKEIATKAHMAELAGASGVYLVDSAGYMLPEDVEKYVRTMKTTVNVPIGFHGHDNLSMGCANCLSAIKGGAQYVDSTLMGLGRGGGNPATETLSALLSKAGYQTEIDTNYCCDIGHTYIKPLSMGLYRSSIDIACGEHGFHSSFLNSALESARKYEVDPRILIAEVCKTDLVNPTNELMDKIADQIQNNKNSTPTAYTDKKLNIRPSPPGNTSRLSLSQICREAAKQLHCISTKTRRTSVLNIVATDSPTTESGVSNFIHEDFEFILCNVTVSSQKELETVIRCTDGIVDHFFVDVGTAPLGALARQLATKSSVIGYRDKDVWIRSIERQIVDLAEQRGLFSQERALVIHGGEEGPLLVAALAEHGLNSVFSNNDTNILTAKELADIFILVALNRQTPINKDYIRMLPSDVTIIDAGIGALTDDAWEYTQQKNMTLLRLDMRAALDAELHLALNTKHVNRNCRGQMFIEGIRVVAGGVVGNKGDIVVDAVPYPSKIIGVADGKGMVNTLRNRYSHDFRKVQSHIRNKLASSEIIK